MTRTQAIQLITSQLATADEATVLTVADILREMHEPVRDLTLDERLLVEQSRADFVHGRTVTLDECMQNVDVSLAQRRATRILA
jgi:hypothetical protein